jgi:acetyl-CoA acyltransferase
VEEVYLDEKGKKQKRNYTVETDEGPRADTSVEVLAKLKPAFAAGGCVTAGNSSQTSDGAAFVIVMGEKMMNELGLKPIGRLVACMSAAFIRALWESARWRYPKSDEAGQYESFSN